MLAPFACFQLRVQGGLLLHLEEVVNFSVPSRLFLGFVEKKTRPIDFSLGSDEGLDKLPTSPAGRTALKVRASVAMDAPAHVIGALACRGHSEGARQLQRQRHKW